MLPPPGVVASTTSLLDAVTTSAAFAIATIAPYPADIPTVTQGIAAALQTSGAIAAGSNNGPHHDAPNGECRLLGPFALIVQAALGGLALLALVYKRWRERPQRPLKVWWFDVSKQVVGSVLVHIANLVMSMLSSGQFSIKLGPEHVKTEMEVASDDHYQPNPCSFYLLNLAIDTTIGIPILIVLLRIITALLLMTPFGDPPESIRSGHYGQPPKARWWFKQSIIYFLGLLGMKICVLLIFLVLPWISRVGDWALRWTEGNEKLQVFFVMLFFPVIMNATQYYIIDSFIKNQKPGEQTPLSGADPTGYDGADSAGAFADPTADAEDDLDSEDEAEIAKKEALDIKAGAAKMTSKGRHSYDPRFDGESSPTVVGSSSNSERGHLLGDNVCSATETKPLRG